jgi:Ala-tRNA(Pro) deacylase
MTQGLTIPETKRRRLIRINPGAVNRQIMALRALSPHWRAGGDARTIQEEQMPIKTLTKFLDQNQVKYVTIRHSLAYTAQGVAASAHISGRDVAKTVMVKLDGKMAMAVLRASDRIDLDLLRSASSAETVELASEAEFQGLFPGVEPGAMPPFGNLYDMDVYVDETLAQDEHIAFNAGSHTELIQLDYTDYARSVEPRMASFAR